MNKRKPGGKPMKPEELPFDWYEYYQRYDACKLKRREYLFWWRKTLIDCYICDGKLHRRIL
jgi:hypothetical protein